ncbi:MAG: Crp/Fnr family transcriptional regulator [Gemmatimonadota bacterium]
MPYRLEPARDRKLYRLVRNAPHNALLKGQALYESGNPADEVFLVREGFVRLVLPAMEKGRRARTVAVALPWEIFGDEALTGGVRRYGAVAGTRALVQPLPRDRVLQGLKTARRTLDAYLEGVERELHRLRHAQGGTSGPSAAQRLADVLLDLAHRCGERVGRGIALSVRPTHQVLADLSRAHRATVTTLLNDWLYEGVLRTDADNHLVVSRPEELWALAGYHDPRGRGETSVDPDSPQV